MMPLIFVVDPSPERRGVVQYALEQAGYRVEVFATTRAIEVAEQRFPSLMIVAFQLPDGNGVLLRDRVRHHPTLSSTTVVMLADCRLNGGNAVNDGTEDCLVFPFAPGELVKAVEDMLRPAAGGATSRAVRSKVADIVIDPFAMKVFVRGKEVTTTTLEFRLLDYLARHQGKVFSRDALLDAVWGDLQFVTPRSVDACIRRIRRKIEQDSASPALLKTVRGTGYKLDAKPVWEMKSEDVCQCEICCATRRRLSATAESAVSAAGSSVRRFSLRAFGKALAPTSPHQNTSS
jgi:DNA-binding response OmpR family regulator